MVDVTAARPTTSQIRTMSARSASFHSVMRALMAEAEAGFPFRNYLKKYCAFYERINVGLSSTTLSFMLIRSIKYIFNAQITILAGKCLKLLKKSWCFFHILEKLRCNLGKLSNAINERLQLQIKIKCC